MAWLSHIQTLNIWLINWKMVPYNNSSFVLISLKNLPFVRSLPVRVFYTGDWRLETGDWRLETGDWRQCPMSGLRFRLTFERLSSWVTLLRKGIGIQRGFLIIKGWIRFLKKSRCWIQCAPSLAVLWILIRILIGSGFSGVSESGSGSRRAKPTKID